MIWKNLRKSNNVIDKRKPIVRTTTVSVFVGILGTIVGLFTIYGPKLPSYITNSLSNPDKVQSVNYNSEQQRDFISSMLGVTEDVWKSVFTSKGSKLWKEPKLILFTDQVISACGNTKSSYGPFYCSGDSTVYIDLDFFTLLDHNLKVVGDASQAYVIFHEVGHHIQNITGILPLTYVRMKGMSTKNSNELSVRLELQADCYAGIVFNKSQMILEPGDVDEFINAASRIGDDWLQTRVGQVMPDTFTHGTSEQRAAWLLHGYKHGDIISCDTFAQSDNVIKN